jgi:hypothetical protein
VGDVDIVERGQGPLLGHLGVERRRDPRRLGDRRAPPPAQAGDGAAAVQPVRARRVEKEYARLYEDIGLGLTTWSPLASGLLTGKYLDGVPEGSRASLEGYEWLRDRSPTSERNAKVRELAAIADELGCTLAQLAIAWCARTRTSPR